MEICQGGWLAYALLRCEYIVQVYQCHYSAGLRRGVDIVKAPDVTVPNAAGLQPPPSRSEVPTTLIELMHTQQRLPYSLPKL